MDNPDTLALLGIHRRQTHYSTENNEHEHHQKVRVNPGAR
jgi:hypothetical protein